MSSEFIVYNIGLSGWNVPGVSLVHHQYNVTVLITIAVDKQGLHLSYVSVPIAQRIAFWRIVRLGSLIIDSNKQSLLFGFVISVTAAIAT